jgi:hypothetical protein
LPASNRTFGPVQISKINGDEGAECGLDISQKEIHPIEPVPALPRGGAAPDYADAMFNLALLLQRGSRYKEAAEYWAISCQRCSI